MAPSTLHLTPATTMTRDGPRSLRVNARLASDYCRLGEDSPAFVVGDAFSLAAHLARAVANERIEDVERYLGAYRAVCEGLGLPNFNAVTRELGLHADPAAARSPIRRRAWDFLGTPHEFDGRAKREIGVNAIIRPAGIGRLLWFRRHAIELQDPWWGALEGDIWGRSAVQGEARDTVDSAIQRYENLADQHLANITAIDNALCALAELPATRSVELNELRSRWGFPAAPDDD